MLRLNMSGQEQVKVEQKCCFDKTLFFIACSADRADLPAECKLETGFIKL